MNNLPYIMDVKDFNREMKQNGTPHLCFYKWKTVTDEETNHTNVVKSKTLVSKGRVCIVTGVPTLLLNADCF